MTNVYGITSDSHVIKSSEWGAVAYLSHSEFGIKKEVRVNNNSSYLTGCGALTDGAAGVNTCDNQYGTKDSYLQSTTGNITGIFDMSGGAWERVMGNYGKTPSSSEFSADLTDLDSKYYDLLNSTNLSIACNNTICYGQALSETAGWYSDSVGIPSTDFNWLQRGGYYNTQNGAGIFSIDAHHGGGSGISTYRITVAHQ